VNIVYGDKCSSFTIRPICVTHTLNFVVFAMCGARTFLPQYVAEDQHRTSRMSLYASRCICLFVDTTEFFVYQMHRYENWSTLGLKALFQQVLNINYNLFFFVVSVLVYKMLRPDKKTYCLLESMQ